MKRRPDAIVVGGGVIGCAVAYELARRSLRVLLLDKSLPGRASSASAGGLWPVGEAVGLGCGVIYHSINNNGSAHPASGSAHAENGSTHPADGSADELGALPDVYRDFLVESNGRFPELAEELLELTGIDIEYQPGAGLIFVVYNDREQRFVDQVARSLPPGNDLTLLSPAEACRIEPRLTRDLQSAALLPGEHQVNPMLLAEAYKRAAIRLGATFRHDTRVTGFSRQHDTVLGVKLAGETVSGGLVINAAGSWSGKLAATANLHVPVFPVRGQIVLTETLPQALHVCLSTSGCYLAQKAHGEVLIGSTTEDAGFDVSVTPEAITSLCRAAVRAVPALARVGLKRIWAGLRPGTSDELPILGPMEGISGYLNATGGFRTGIVASPLTARVVAQCAAGEPTDVPLEPFLADRFGGLPLPADEKQLESRL